MNFAFWKLENSGRTVYNDFQCRVNWQPVLQSVVKPDVVLLKMLNPYEQIYRQEPPVSLQKTNSYRCNHRTFIKPKRT